MSEGPTTGTGPEKGNTAPETPLKSLTSSFKSLFTTPSKPDKEWAIAGRELTQEEIKDLQEKGRTPTPPQSPYGSTTVSYTHLTLPTSV